jgi:hypothetical protein
MVYVFDRDGRCLERNLMTVAPPLANFQANHGEGLVMLAFDEDPHADVPTMAGTDPFRLVDGQVVLDPAWVPPAPPAPDTSILDGLAELTQIVAKNVAVSPHDKRFLADKGLGKTILGWIKANPTCTAQEALEQVARIVWAAIPNEPIIPRMWDEMPHPDISDTTIYFGLGPSYLHEAIKRAYCPAATPMAWASLVGLIVATPDDQLAIWLESL